MRETRGQVLPSHIQPNDHGESPPLGLPMTAANYLRNRWKKELKYWRLRWWEFVLLVLWSAWSLICGWLFPAHPELWLFPQAPFLAFAYLGGGLFMALFPGQPWAYPLGLCFTVFLLTYLALVSWRWHRDGKNPLKKHHSSN